MGRQRGSVTLLICDDHRMLTDALEMVVRRQPGLDLVAPPVGSPEEAVALCERLHPDAVLMDVHFKGGMDGIEGTRRVKEVSPTTKVVIMTAHEDELLMVEAVEAGASGFLGKTKAVEDVLAAAKAAAKGEVLIDPRTLTRLLHEGAREREAKAGAAVKVAHLTPREKEILQLPADGFRNDDIAAKLHISPQTVQTHVRNILYKFDVHSKLEAVAFAVKNGAVAI